MSSHRVADLHPELAIRTCALVDLGRVRFGALGLFVVVVAGLVTHAEQAYRYASGRHEDFPGPRLTDVKPGGSWHEVARAVDVGFRVGGGGALTDGPWGELEELAASVGLEPGPRGQGRAHFQMTHGLDLDEAVAEFACSSLLATALVLQAQELAGGTYPMVDLDELGLA